MQSKLTGCCACTKFLFIFFNIVFFLVGAAALGIGIWAQVSGTFTQQVYKLLEEIFKLDKSDVKTLDVGMVDNAAILIIVGGAVVMVLGFIGCFGAWTENQCLLGTFFTLLFLILGVIVAGVILFTTFTDTLTDNFKPVLKRVVDKWIADPKANGTIVLIQTELKCCGVDGPQDYNEKGQTVPASCKNDKNVIYKEGCLKRFTEEVKESFKEDPWIIVGVGIGVLGILVFGMILSCCLCCAIRKSEGESV